MVAYNVAQLLQSLPGTTREFSFSENLNQPFDDAELLGPVHGQALLTLTSRGILAHVEFGVRAGMACARCLQPVEIDIQDEFDEEFRLKTEARTEQHVPGSDQDDADAATIDDFNVLNLNETLRQAIITVVPLRPLCDEACPGLCPECGERRLPGHPVHPEIVTPVAPPVEKASPFATLAVLLDDNRVHEPAAENKPTLGRSA